MAAASAPGDALGPARNLSAVAQIVFRGTSTLHDFEGRVTSQPFTLSIASNYWSAAAEVLGGGMTTANDKRDRNMWAMLGTDHYPHLSGAVSNAAVPPVAGANITLRLRIRDQEFDLPVSVTEWAETVEAVRFRAAWQVSLKKYGLKPPSVLGVIRVGDTVRLEAQVTATKTGAALGPRDSQTASIPKP
jgi:hypothetical protein